MDEISPSSLGTKEYWDDAYNEEYINYEDHGDCGEIWFGEATVKRIVNWFGNSPLIKAIEKEKCTLLDVGCGNGMFLLELNKFGFKSASGMDYSENAVKLARKIAEKAGENIEIEVGNIIEMTEFSLEKKYDICTDKGTYDAISLDPLDAKSKRHIYIKNISRILQPSTGLLIITSCNWTKQELLTHFSEEFRFVEEIPMPSFQFGGKVGQRVTSLVLQKN